MNPFSKQAPIPGIKRILAVGSGKGGVGKSTVAVNLAYALQCMGLRVGILDADIYGPSVPRMLGASAAQAEMHEGKILPVKKFGLKVMSIGFLVKETDAVIWRGPMLFKAINQFFHDVLWEELDYLIIDLPPGTGDIALSVAQKVPVDGAVIVCTPQNIALADARKAIDMFERINVPILGVVENMSGLFPKGDLDQYLKVKGIKKLIDIAFEQALSLACEAGVVEPSHVFTELALRVRALTLDKT